MNGMQSHEYHGNKYPLHDKIDSLTAENKRLQETIDRLVCELEGARHQNNLFHKTCDELVVVRRELDTLKSQTPLTNMCQLLVDRLQEVEAERDEAVGELRRLSENK
jgi:hypothetical protein